jgi:DNA processing protein
VVGYGIDKAAHEGALNGPGGTVAVLAQGLPDIQPAAHRDLARRIIANGGLLLSEYAAGVQTYKSDYLVRNRIIAGLCKATLVVEAPFKSGAINTAKHAYDNGREVLCVPGRIGDEVCEGTNALLQRGAHVALNPKDCRI